MNNILGGTMHNAHNVQKFHPGQHIILHGRLGPLLADCRLCRRTSGRRRSSMFQNSAVTQAFGPYLPGFLEMYILSLNFIHPTVLSRRFLQQSVEASSTGNPQCLRNIVHIIPYLPCCVEYYCIH